MTVKQRILKTIYPLIMLKGKWLPSKIDIQKNVVLAPSTTSIYDLELVLNDGNTITLNKYKGQKLVIVNTASDCGYTGQYDELESVYTEYKGKVMVIAFPANNFQNQESADDNTIAQFCRMNYGISFPIAKKTSVIKNTHQHPIFQWLSSKEKNGWCRQAPIWNFCKYVINEEGILTHFFSQNISPTSKVFLASLV
ncbi:glutathione peroxidase [Parasediminibacterium paludis]|uniref:Glutathione peroxidase n=1 Tax=Parasediminibacterium paludis TaxID=908966 RepID=A0ABV8PZK7_9BACT